jgi:hypothetical protein
MHHIKTVFGDKRTKVTQAFYIVTFYMLYFSGRKMVENVGACPPSDTGERRDSTKTSGPKIN